jgi:glycosyltransferase involved in cell wall biosynthesis
MDKEEFLGVAVLIPCYNESLTISSVVRQFKDTLPGAIIYVFDNDSTDNTGSLAKLEGAIVRKVYLRGKGNVVRRMFADVQAEIYVLVDGDDTYSVKSSPEMIRRLIHDGLDMVLASRVANNEMLHRFGHRIGNILLTRAMAFIFGRFFSDMLSGYRVFSRRFVKSFPAHSKGFETETELTIHALQLRMPVAEISTPYAPRPVGSFSKLNTFQDGIKILVTIFNMFKIEKPLYFFSLAFSFCVIAALILIYPVFITYLNTGLVPRFPTLITSSALILLGFIFLACGIVIDVVTRGRNELKRFIYLSVSPLNTCPSIER